MMDGTTMRLEIAVVQNVIVCAVAKESSDILHKKVFERNLLHQLSFVDSSEHYYVTIVPENLGLTV